MYSRTNTRSVLVGNLQIGGNDHVYIQSMTNTSTKDVISTIEQILALEKSGCELVRVAVLDEEDARSIGKIKESIHIPVVADIHFDHKLALICIEQGIDKIRINPGNIGSVANIKEVVDMCKKFNVPIRIGINSGSLKKHVLDIYKKPTPEAMVESARYHVSILENLGFRNIVISLKSTDMLDTIKANRLAAEMFPYPLHLGITEAGTKFTGTIRSSIGLGVLLEENIGSTIRISLTDDPVEEINVAKEILANFHLYKKPILISCPTCGRIQYDMIPVATEIEKFLMTINKEIKVAIMGCIVNGPGEAKDANIAVAGGKDEALLYIDGKKVKKVKQEQLVEVLKQAILEY